MLGRLHILKDSNDWFEDAFCLGADPEDFFDETLEDDIISDFCSICPVRDLCLQYGLENKNIFGVWGGVKSIDMRKALSTDTYTRPTTKRPICPRCKNKQTELDRSQRTENGVFCPKCGLKWKASVKLKVFLEYDINEDDKKENE